MVNTFVIFIDACTPVPDPCKVDLMPLTEVKRGHACEKMDCTLTADTNEWKKMCCNDPTFIVGILAEYFIYLPKGKYFLNDC